MDAKQGSEIQLLMVNNAGKLDGGFKKDNGRMYR
jgi:hypothetical protein